MPSAQEIIKNLTENGQVLPPFHIWKKKGYHLVINLLLLWYFRCQGKPREVIFAQCPRCLKLGARIHQHYKCSGSEATSKEERRDELQADKKSAKLHQKAFLCHQSVSSVHLEEHLSPYLRKLFHMAQPDKAVSKHYFPLTFV